MPPVTSSIGAPQGPLSAIPNSVRTTHWVWTSRWARLGRSWEIPSVFLGDDLIVWLVLAVGGAMAAGNLMAMIRPPETRRETTDLDQAPRGRSIVFVIVGTVAAIWAVASLISG